jgi:hypothetical protein
MSNAVASAPPPKTFSREVRLAFAPEETYRQLLFLDAPISGWRALRRPAVTLLVIGVAVPIMAVQRVTIGLFVNAVLFWSFVVAIQFAVGVALIASAPARQTPDGQALDLWFSAHLPYSLWLLLAAAWFASVPGTDLEMLVFSAILPAAWTAVLVSGFCRVVLNASAAGARWRAAAHQVVTWSIGLSYVAWSAGGWFQVIRPLASIVQ